METKQEWHEDYIGHLIQDGFYDKLIIIGFPYDEGAKRNGARGGSDYGPDSFRRFVKDIGVIQNQEYGVDIAKGLPKISDYGNIQIVTQQPQASSSLQDLHEKLTTKVGLCIQRGNIPFVFGGSRDIFGAVSDALLKQTGKRNTFISINHTLDVKLLLDQGVPHQSSNKRYMLEEMNKESDRLIEFGLNSLSVTSTDIEYFNSKNPNGKVYWMQNIKKHKLSDKLSALTQAGQLFESLISQFEDGTDQIYLSINMENIEGAAGVTSNCVTGCMKTEEIIEICYLAGLKMQKLVAIDINEYNPFVEDWRTGRLVASMFYYFALGMSSRLQQKQ